ncbi:integrase core domain-containing protein, partial [Serratia marcescens]|uniref:integrase core domain-containing protein n=2 Tax=Serratia TaxID=613 RepID=UPI00355C2966
MQPDVPERNPVRTLNEAREITERWLTEYNIERLHESLNNLSRKNMGRWPRNRKSQKMYRTKAGILTRPMLYIY